MDAAYQRASVASLPLRRLRDRAETVHRADDRVERRADDARLAADAPRRAPRGVAHLDVGDRDGVLAVAERMLGVVEDVDVEPTAAAKRVDERVDRAGALAAQAAQPAVDPELRAHLEAAARERRIGVVHELEPAARGRQVLALEELVERLRRHLLLARVGHGLHRPAELDLEP